MPKVLATQSKLYTCRTAVGGIKAAGLTKCRAATLGSSRAAAPTNGRAAAFSATIIGCSSTEVTTDKTSHISDDGHINNYVRVKRISPLVFAMTDTGMTHVYAYDPIIAHTSEFYEFCGASKREAKKFAKYPEQIYARAVNRALDSYYLNCRHLMVRAGDDPRTCKLGGLMLRHFEAMEGRGIYINDYLVYSRHVNTDKA